MATSAFETFQARLGIKKPTLKGVGYGYTPTIMQQGQTADQIGQNFIDRIGGRKSTGQDLYNANKNESMTRLANDVSQKSAGLKFDEWGKPNVTLADFGSAGQSQLKGITQHGDLATQIAQNKQAFNQAVQIQNLQGFGIDSSSFSVTGTGIPGAASGNIGAQAAEMAMKVAANKTPYVWGGNSLSNGVDCSGLVQQIYKQLGVSVPRTTYEQAKNGKQISVNQIRPGDLVFYYGDLRHVGIYIGNGKVVHAANSKLGTITSNLSNSNGAPTLVLRPY